MIGSIRLGLLDLLAREAPLRSRALPAPREPVPRAVSPAAGVALAKPGARVIALVGDGSAMYSVQALWSAAQLELPITAALAAGQGVEGVRVDRAERLPAALADALAAQRLHLVELEVA